MEMAVKGGGLAEAGAGLGIGAEMGAEFGRFGGSQSGLRPGVEEGVKAFRLHESSEVPSERSTQARRVWRARVSATRTELGVQPTAAAMASGIWPRW